MILNLLTNAIKYSKEVSRPKIKLSVRRDDQVYIVVEDNGIGIKKKKKIRQIYSIVFTKWINREKPKKTASVWAFPW